MAYLDNNGLLYFWQALKTLLAGKVDTVSGKGLSENDFTTTLKNKLDGIASGAQANVIDTVKVNGSALTPSSKAVDVTVPTKTSDLTNDSSFITSSDIPEGAAASNTTPKMDGTAAKGSETAFARGDHVHPTDTSRQAKITASGLLKGDGSGGVTAATSGTDYQAPLPSQTSNSGKFLTTNGTTISWAAVDALPSQTGKSGKYLYTNGSSASWESAPDISGKLDKSGGTMTGALTLSGAPSSNLHAATKKYVDDAIATAQTGAAMNQGAVNSNTTISSSSYKNGWYWFVETAGTYVGETCEVGDMIVAIADKGSSYSTNDFIVIQHNLNISAITNGEIDTIMAS